MARFFITRVGGGDGGVFEVTGQVLDRDAGINTGLSVGNLLIDTAAYTSARQQIQEQLVSAVNLQLIASSIPLTFIASDIEWVC